MKYGFYPGCSYKSEAGYKESVEAVCRLIGIELRELPDWNCCGATSMISMDADDAHLLTARIFALACKEGFDAVVTTCNACYTALRKTRKILEADSGLLADINKQLSSEGLNISSLPSVRHLLEVFYQDVDAASWTGKASPGIADIAVAAYYGCQLTRPWGDVDHPERPQMLDEFIKRLGYKVVDHSARTLCCGASHFFPYQEQCRSLVDKIIAEARRKGAQVITTLCPLCQLNLDAGQETRKGPPMPVPYFTQLAGLALGLSPVALGLNKLLNPMDTLLRKIR